MNQLLHGVVRAISEAFDLPGPVLEIGAHEIEGQEDVCAVREFFAGRDYLGLDIRPGPGVDVIGDVESLPQPDASVGTVLALSLFEHVRRFWRGFDEVRRVLRPDGVFLLSCPFHLRIHGFPNDYWRFTPAAIDLLLEDYPQRIIGYHGPGRRPINVWAVAFGPACPQLTQAQFARYKRLLREYARQPLGWAQKLRYRVGAAVCGSRPFTPYLQQDHWATECPTPLQP